LIQKDIEICANACWAFSHLTNVDDKYLDKVVTHHLILRLAALCDHKELHIRVPAVRSIGNILSGKDEYTYKFIEAGILKKLDLLLGTKKCGFRREVIWAISNILANDSNTVAKVLVSSNIMPKLLAMMMSDIDDVNIFFTNLI